MSSFARAFRRNARLLILYWISNTSRYTRRRWILNDAVGPLTGGTGCVVSLCDLPTYINPTQEQIAETTATRLTSLGTSVTISDTVIDGYFPLYLRRNITMSTTTTRA